MTTFTLSIASGSGSFSHTVTFRPEGETTEVREWMRDELLGAWWSGCDGRPQRMTTAEAREMYRGLLRKRYRRN